MFTFKAKLIFVTILLVILAGFITFFNVEVVQKKVYDFKADLVGSNRTVTFYSPMTGTLISSYSDRDLRYEVSSNGETISVWLGSSNKKIHSNMGYIIEDK